MKHTPADITPAIKSAVNAVLMARAIYEVERERMDKLDMELLQEKVYRIDQRSLDKCASRSVPEGRLGPDCRIILPKDTWLMSEADSKEYHAERQRRIDAMGYKLPPGHCPALVAECTLRDANRVLVECAKDVFHVTFDQLLCAGLEKLEKYIDLLVRLVVNLPDFKNPLPPPPTPA